MSDIGSFASSLASLSRSFSGGGGRYRVPVLKVFSGNSADIDTPIGDDLVTIWGSSLVGVRIVDRIDEQSDEATITFTDEAPYVPIPAVGKPFTIHIGWEVNGLPQAVLTGYYTFQRAHFLGQPKQGQMMQWICRAADFTGDSLKKVDSQHYDKDTGHKTLGDIFTSLFPGQTVSIYPSLANRPIPGGYDLRWNQSAMDYAIDLAERNGAIVKPSGNRIIVLKRGIGLCVSGKALPTIGIDRSECYEFDVELEPRFQFQSVSASYFDADGGQYKSVSRSTGFSGGHDALPHPFPTADAAQDGADARSAEWSESSATGLFTVVGRADAVAGAPVKCTGFRPHINKVPWKAASVQHDIDPNGGWITTIETDVKVDDPAEEGPISA